MTIEIYKRRMGYVAYGMHDGRPYSFAGITILEAIDKALKYIFGVQ